MKRINIWTVLGLTFLLCLFIVFAASEDCDTCYAPPTMAVKYFICGLVLIGITLYYRWQFKEHESIAFDIESLPAMKTDEVVEGVPFAGTGRVASENGRVLTAPFSGLPCVYHHSIMEQYVKQGKSSHWKAISNVARFIPFHLEDERGNVNIDLTNIDEDFSDFARSMDNSKIPNPRHSEIECFKVLNKASYRDPDAKANFFGFATGRRLRRTESVLRPGTGVFVCGMGAREGTGQLALREDMKLPLIITTKSREDFVAEFYKGSGLIFWSYVLIAIGFSLSFWAANHFLKLNNAIFVPLMFFSNMVILGGIVFSVYNRMVTFKNRALGALSNIEVELKRRADLIPNLAEAVKGYAGLERSVQQFVALARAGIFYSVDERAAKTSKLVPVLAAVVERYPELKASENFGHLMREISDTENRIAYSREFYNRNAQKYNTMTEQFPYLLVARAFNFRPMQFISIAESM